MSAIRDARKRLDRLAQACQDISDERRKLAGIMPRACKLLEASELTLSAAIAALRGEEE